LSEYFHLRLTESISAYGPQGEETVPEYPHYRGKREIGKGRKRYQLSAFSRQLESYKFSLYEAVPKMTIWNYLYGFPIRSGMTTREY
jgi:hypothetical protein